MNPMREIRIEKVTLNIGCGDDKEKLARAEKLLKKITNKKPVITRTHKRTTFGAVKHKPIGAMVTLRSKNAEEFLANLFKAVDNTLRENQVNPGNFSVGLKEYIDLPNVSYDPDIGILGMDVAVTLERRGFRVKRRKLKKANIGKAHNISKEETIEWLKQVGVNLIGE